MSLRAFPACCDPVVSLFVYCLLEEACRYRRYFEAIQGPPAKSDPGEDCRWTVALRHSSRVRSTNLVSELHRRTTSEGIRRTKEGVLRRAAVSKWTQKFCRKVGQFASHDVLCCINDVFRMIDIFRGVYWCEESAYKVAREKTTMRVCRRLRCQCMGMPIACKF